MYAYLSAPLMIQWELTEWCNNRCLHCYNEWRHADEKAETPTQIVDDTVYESIAKAVVSAGIFHVTLTGGEPLGVLKRMYPYLRYAYERGVRFSINTNLTVMSEELGLLMKGLGIKTVLTSLISHDREMHNAFTRNAQSFAKTLSGIELAIRMGFDVSINTVVTTQNLATLVETGEMAARLGAKSFYATRMAVPCGATGLESLGLKPAQVLEMFRSLSDVKGRTGLKTDTLEPYPACSFGDSTTRTLFGKRNCTAGRTSCTIGADGNLRPCSHAPFIYGNAREGVTNGWASMGYWRDGTLIPDRCKACKEYPKGCVGGCRVEAYNSTGKLDGEDPYITTCACIPGRTRSEPSTGIREHVVVHVNKSVRYRPESFGCVAYLSQTNWLALDQKLYGVLVESGDNEFDEEALARMYGTSTTEARKTLKVLLSKELVVAST